MKTSILNLPACYTISHELINGFVAQWVIRLNDKFILSHENDAVAKNLARVHASFKYFGV